MRSMKDEIHSRRLNRDMEWQQPASVETRIFSS